MQNRNGSNIYPFSKSYDLQTKLPDWWIWKHKPWISWWSLQYLHHSLSKNISSSFLPWNFIRKCCIQGINGSRYFFFNFSSNEKVSSLLLEGNFPQLLKKYCIKGIFNGVWKTNISMVDYFAKNFKFLSIISLKSQKWQEQEIWLATAKWWKVKLLWKLLVMKKMPKIYTKISEVKAPKHKIIAIKVVVFVYQEFLNKLIH